MTSPPDPTVLVTVRRANGDPEAPGHVIGVTHGRHAVTDPIAALTDWTRHHGRLIGTLFLRMPITFGERRCRAAD
jgi:hypothetical protein